MTATDSKQIRGWPVIFYNQTIIFALAYALAVMLGVKLVTAPEGLSISWPASGVALAVLLARPPREWGRILAFIYFVNLAANLATGTAWLISAAFALVNSLEPALGGWFMTRFWGNRIIFSKLGHVVGLVLTATLINGITAFLGASIPFFAYGTNLRTTFVTWWILDGISIMMFTSLFVSWITRNDYRHNIQPNHKFETIAWLAILSLSTFFIFGVSGFDIYVEPRPYMLFPVLLWAALRFTPRSSSAALVWMTTIALLCTYAGIGSIPLGGETTRERMIAVQGFFFVASMTAMTLSATLVERKTAEYTIQRSEKRFRALVENSADSVTLLGADGSILYEDPTVTRLTGYSAEERLGKNGFSNVHPDDMQSVRAIFGQVLAHPSDPITTQFRAIRKDGSLWWTEATATNMIEDPNVQSVVINYRDITLRKQAEIELQESEKRLFDMVNAAPYGSYVYELHPDGRLVLVNANKSADTIIGISHTALIGKTIEEAFPGLEATEIPDAYRRVAATGELYYLEQIAYNEGAITGVYEVHGIQISPNRMAVFFRDITERKRAEKERERLLGELERKNHELESIVYVASHDLRSPLVNIQGFGRNLQKYCSQFSEKLGTVETLEEFRTQMHPILSERIPSALRFISSSSAKMDTLIDGLLRLSRIGRAQLQSMHIEMGEMIQNIVDSMEFQIENAGAKVQIQKPLAGCQGDKNQLNQVFSNLLDNALKYRDPARPLTIDISSRVNGNVVTYTIADNGLGIAPENQEKIWEIFRRIDDDTIPGEGLGLTIARRIVERHSGNIRVESTLGIGSKFIIELPLTA